ncbi:alpha/beta hydrolase [Pararhizobium sp.]|uniref:alpha/beta hydrolase n=1 Tax=Pararhizobium sp. TaxID=1977563 RepID=UPI0027240F2F|nr:alpha/beta hydrolase [Pararhizobium sp.]MDO9415528.1 alpha/beta hydrolase [Pararhizobium sp.]
MDTDPFRIRAHVADFDAIVEDIIAASERTRKTLRMEADVAYGTGGDETLDIFFPAGAREKLPVHMFIHGGYWRMFSKRDYSYVAETVTRAGAIAVIVDYSLMPGVRMAVLVDQVRRATRWVVENISGYGGDASRLTVSGHSAGAHLATFLLHQQASASVIRAALLLGGIYDLKPLQTSFLAPEIGITDKEVMAFSPVSHSYDARCHVIVAVGADETPPFHQQATEFAISLEQQGLAVSVQTIYGANHMSSVRDLGWSGSASGTLLNTLLMGV